MPKLTSKLKKKKKRKCYIRKKNYSIETMSYWTNDRHMDQRNIINSPEIKHHIGVQLTCEGTPVQFKEQGKTMVSFTNFARKTR